MSNTRRKWSERSAIAEGRASCFEETSVTLKWGSWSCALCSRQLWKSFSVESAQSRFAIAAVLKMSTSVPSVVTPSFQMNVGSIRAVCTRFDSSGSVLHGGGSGVGFVSVQPAARSFWCSASVLASFVSAAVWRCCGSFGSRAAADPASASAASSRAMTDAARMSRR